MMCPPSNPYLYSPYCNAFHCVVRNEEHLETLFFHSHRTRTCIIFRSLGGEPIDDNYETETCGIRQLETVDLETLSLFKLRTDLACLQDLLNAKCFIGKAHNVVCDFCAWTIVSIYHMLTFYMFMFMQYLDIMDSQRSGICLIGKCLFNHYRICEI